MVNVYDAIIYAADHGCKLSNCSWGSTISSGQYGQDAINYATINKDALVIAGAGNNGIDSKFYPASYDNVISVAATDNSDVKWTSSNYNYDVDICAPGVNLYSISNGTSYNTASGTSLSAALVAGGAALLRSYFRIITPCKLANSLKIRPIIFMLLIPLTRKNLVLAGSTSKEALPK